MWWRAMKNIQYTNNMRHAVFLSLILYSRIFCFPIGREVIFHRVNDTDNEIEHNNPAVISDFIVKSAVIKFNINEDYYKEDSETFFKMYYSKDIIKLTLSDDQKIPFNFRSRKDIEESKISENSVRMIKIEYLTIKHFESFLLTYYLPQKNIFIKDFFNFIYLFEAIDVKFDHKFVKIIENLGISLFNAEKMYSIDFKEELVNAFQMNLISRKCSFFVFKILFEIFFLDLTIINSYRFSGTNYNNIPIIIRGMFKERSWKDLLFGEISLLTYLDENKSTKIQENIISLILYILNYNLVEIRLLFIKNLRNLRFILTLLVGSIENVVLCFEVIDNSLISLINECSFFKKVKNISILDTKLNDATRFLSIDLTNLETLTISENDISKTDTIICKEFRKVLESATENEIKESKSTGNDKTKDNPENEYKIRSSKYHQLLKPKNPSNTQLNIRLPTIYKYFIYNIHGVILNDNLVNINILSVQNCKIKNLNSLSIFSRFKIDRMRFSCSDINSSILTQILRLNFLEELEFFNSEIQFKKNELLFDRNTSILRLRFRNTKISILENLVTLVSLMKNIETLNIKISNKEILPGLNDPTFFPKIVLKELHFYNENSTSESIDLCFIRFFIILETLVVFFGHENIFANNFSEYISDDLKTLNIFTSTFTQRNVNVFKKFEKIRNLEIQNCSFERICFHELFSSYSQYKFAVIKLADINITIEDIIFFKNLVHLKELYFHHCKFLEKSYSFLTKRNFMFLNKLVYDSLFYESESKEIYDFISTEFSTNIFART